MPGIGGADLLIGGVVVGDGRVPVTRDVELGGAGAIHDSPPPPSERRAWRTDPYVDL